MIKSTMLVLAIAAAGFAAVAPASAGGRGHQASCPELNRLDPDGDGSFGFFEAMNRAREVFKSINDDGDRTLEPDETRGRVSRRAFAAGNPDNDGSLDIFEWKRIARARFNAANPDRDFSIECDEINTEQGRILYWMLR